jgi:hypothetical protein
MKAFWNTRAVVTSTALGAVILIVAFVGAAFKPTVPNPSLAGQTAALAILTATAIGIERFLEGCWTVVDMGLLAAERHSPGDPGSDRRHEWGACPLVWGYLPAKLDR